MKTKTQFKQEMRKYFREAVDKAVGETFASWFDNLWAELEADGQVIKISGTNYVKDGSDSEPKSSGGTDATDATQKLKETVKAAIIKDRDEADVIDLRNFKDAVNAAVSEESDADERCFVFTSRNISRRSAGKTCSSWPRICGWKGAGWMS